MNRRLPEARLAWAVLLASLAWASHAAAKPPDLPVVDNNVLAPVEAGADSGPITPRLAGASRSESPAMEAPAFLPMRPSARRMLASCLLFGVHPLLGLAPADAYVDFDDDEYVSDPNQRVIEWLKETDDLRRTADEWERYWHIHDPEPTAESVCPYMREQQQCGARRTTPPADEMANDVSQNLDLLRRAHVLLETAREFGRDGRVGEALECIDLARDLCPAGRLDDAVRRAAAEIFVPIYCGAPADVYGAEEPSEPPAPKSVTPCLPPVDPGTPAALDQLYREVFRSTPAGGAEEEEPRAATEVGGDKDDSNAWLPHGSFEFGFGLDGSLQLFTQLRRGGDVWHVFYGSGGLSVWSAPDGGADVSGD